VILNIPVIFTNPKAGSSGEKEAAGSEETVRTVEWAKTGGPGKIEESNGGVMDIKTIKIEKPEELNLILGHSHFIKNRRRYL